MTSIFCGFRSAPTFALGRHQDRVTHHVTIIHVPQVRQASIFLQSMSRDVTPVSFSGPPNSKLETLCNLAVRSACKRWISEGSSTPIHGRLPDLQGSHASTRFSRHHTQSQAAVSLFCTPVLGHWREPFLLHMRQVFDVSMLLLLLLPCAWGETSTPPRALPAIRSSQSSFSRRLRFWPAGH